MKKVFSLILLSLVLSCSNLESKKYYTNGEYIKALNSAAVEFTTVSPRSQYLIKNRIEKIIKIHEDNLKKYSTQKERIKSKFDMFLVLKTISDNPILVENTSALRRHSAKNNLSDAVEIAKDYYKYYEDMDVLENLYSRMKKEKLKNTNYYDVYNEFADYIANIYYLKASSNEKNNIVSSIEFYTKAYQAYSEFENDYKGSKIKAEELKQKKLENKFKKIRENLEK